MCNAIVPAYYLAISQNNLHRITSTAHCHHTHVFVADRDNIRSDLFTQCSFPFPVCVCVWASGGYAPVCVSPPHPHTPFRGSAVCVCVTQSNKSNLIHTNILIPECHFYACVVATWGSLCRAMILLFWRLRHPLWLQSNN